MHRLFVALDPPEDLSARLAALSTDELNGRWVPAGNHHLTLKFIGRVDTSMRDRVAEALSGISQAAPRISLREISVFPNWRRPSVLVILVDEDPALMQLQRTVEDELHQLGIAREGRPYRPHITLARLKDAAPSAVRAYANRTEIQADSFSPGVFRLYESNLSPRGATYTSLSDFPLHSPT